MPCQPKCTLHNIVTLQKCEICSSCRTQCRKEETRNVEGVPLLKRGSRGKGAAIPIQAITAAAARSARQGQSLRLQIVALQILGLKQVFLQLVLGNQNRYQCALCNIMVSLEHPALLMLLRCNRAAPACLAYHVHGTRGPLSLGLTVMARPGRMFCLVSMSHALGELSCSSQPVLG